jgi:hypothetical protein
LANFIANPCSKIDVLLTAGASSFEHLYSENYYSAAIDGGADRDRTGDPLLAKQVLSQLSYSPLAKLRASKAPAMNFGGPG